MLHRFLFLVGLSTKLHQQHPRLFHSRTTAAILKAQISFKLADIGEGIAEVEVLKWFIGPGQKIHQFDKVCEVSSDKATVEISSRYDGIVKTLNFNVGDMAPVGASLIEIEVPDGAASSGEEGVGLLKESSTAPSSTPKPKTTTTMTSGNLENTSDSNKKLLATPAVRSLIRENHIDISRIKGTGKDGRVTKGDVLEFIEGKTPDVAPVNSSSSSNTTPTSSTKATLVNTQDDETIKLTGIRKQMAKSMTLALKIPHLQLMEEVRMNNLYKLRKDLIPMVEAKGGGKLSYLPFFIKAASLSLIQYPDVNSLYDHDKGELIRKASHNISIAMDTPRGLLVPVIKDVQNRSVLSIAVELKRLQKLGSENKLGESELSGSTFTLSNIGSIGGTYACPVIPPPQTCIMAIGRLQEIPRFDSKGEVFPCKIVNISLGADHRVIDGATITRFAISFKELVEDPWKMILDMK